MNNLKGDNNMQFVGTDANGNLRVVGRIQVKGNNNTVVVHEDNDKPVVVEGDNNTIIVGEVETEVKEVETDIVMPLSQEEMAAYRDYLYVRKIAVYRKTLKARDVNKNKIAYKINKLLGIEGR